MASYIGASAEQEDADPILMAFAAEAAKGALCGLCRDDGLQVGEFVRGVMANTGSLAKFLPAVIFIVACFIGFATGTSWGTIGIMVPLVCAVFDWYDQSTLLSISLRIFTA